jgi:hypothetical protein
MVLLSKLLVEYIADICYCGIMIIFLIIVAGHL